MTPEVIALIITNLLAPIVAYFLARRKNNADVQLTEFDSVEKAIKIWRETAESMSAKINLLQQEIDELKKQNDELLLKLRTQK